MASLNPAVVNFSGGIIGGELHNRVDIPSYQGGCEQMTNFRPTIQGVMMRRPPMVHVDSFDDHSRLGELFPFNFSTSASYLVLATLDGFKIYANDGLITIPEVTASLGSATDESDSPSSMSTVDDKIFLDGDGANYAAVEFEVTVNEVDTLHVVSFEIVHGPIDILVGTASGLSDLMYYTRLRAGFHKLAFTPSGSSAFIRFRHNGNAGRVIRNTVEILAGPTYTLTCPFDETALGEVHTQQIRDVLYMTHEDYWPRRLERRGDRSWSIVLMLPDDGPFGDINTTNTTLAGDGTSGEILLNASDDVFTADDEGVLYALTAPGQNRTTTATAADVYTDGIKVTGIGSSQRSFVMALTGSFTATVTLQRSSGNENNYQDWQTYTGATSISVYDAQDNQTWYYRLAVKPGNFTSGTVVMNLTYAGGSTTGIVRVVQYNSPTQCVAEVIETLASTEAVKTWKRGDWNATDGFPSAITDGYARLWFARGDKVWASKSDDFTSFESVTDEADSSFSRNMATPSSDGVRWMAKLAHLVIGTAAVEQVGLGNTNSEPIGPANFQFLPGSEEGGAGIQPVVASGSVIFVHRNRRQLMQFTQNPKALSETSYISVDLTARAPEILDARIVDIAVQREPERRIYVVLESGKLCELLFRREGDVDVVAWSVVQTSGRVERVTILPRQDEDIVYFITRRQNAAGTWQRFIERLGKERVLMDCDRYHLDAALGYELETHAVTITPSATTSDITIAADEPVFASGDVGKVIWLNGGRATITAYSNTQLISATVTSTLTTDEPAAPYRWGKKTPASSLTGLSHLEGQTVRVWGDMTDLGTAVVSSGSITLDQSVSVAYVGLPYRSRWKSLKLAYGAQKGTALGMFKAIKSIVLLLYKTASALKYGSSYSKLYEVPTRTAETPYGEPVPLFTGEKLHAFSAKYEADTRLCFEVDGPAPCILAGYVPLLDEKDR